MSDALIKQLINKMASWLG